MWQRFVNAPQKFDDLVTPSGQQVGAGVSPLSVQLTLWFRYACGMHVVCICGQLGLLFWGEKGGSLLVTWCSTACTDLPVLTPSSGPCALTAISLAISFPSFRDRMRSNNCCTGREHPFMSLWQRDVFNMPSIVSSISRSVQPMRESQHWSRM